MIESQIEELTGMTQDERLSVIEYAVKKATRQLGVSLEGGLMDYTKEDVQDEVENIDRGVVEVEGKPDFDADENEVDMDTISPLMREVENAK
jgi:hypothetical protein|tara:strand:- start:255 stop:530 length:276 start_codon:yes stop_codon:yes gene_type:complete